LHQDGHATANRDATPCAAILQLRYATPSQQLHLAASLNAFKKGGIRGKYSPVDTAPLSCKLLRELMRFLWVQPIMAEPTEAKTQL
jgi:hypothetical protein